MKYQKILSKSATPLVTDTPLKVLHHTVCLPAALLKYSAIQQNIQWMQSFAEHNAVQLAPHGKTSMLPWLFQQQLAAGAWGITVATAYQAQIAAEAGAKRVILANQLIGKANMALIALLLSQGVQLYVCVDHPENARALSTFFQAEDLCLPVLIELGVAGGRCGCRSIDEAMLLARTIATLPGLALAGVEFYEGVINAEAGEAKVFELVQQAANLAKGLANEQLLTHSETLITGAGSAWYDVVAMALNNANLPKAMQIILRPGCYISHDTGIYQQAQNTVLARNQAACCIKGELKNALEIAAYVQSLPEPGMAVLGFGKRDAAFDAGLPKAQALYRDGELINANLAECETLKVMDQHAFWRYDATVVPAIGDIVILSTSHPCLTFDKWRSVWLIDDNYTVLQRLDSYF